MANPRDLAEQAFALLQNALRQSEARAEDLNEQLERKKAPKNKLEEQLDVLSHRLESAEMERSRWQREAGHLEEIVEAERAKVEQLKKKLEIAEGGPEKLTKKEVNFWRAKAEDMDTETRDYKTRLANLRKEVLERDAIIERLKTDGQIAAPAYVPEPGPSHQRLESTDRAAGHAETQPVDAAELAELKQQLDRRERELATIKADLSKTQEELADQLRVVREAQATSERTKQILSEREHRLIEVSAELGHTRAEVAQNRERESTLRDSVAELGERIAALTRDLETARHHDQQRRNQLQQAEVDRDQARAQWQESQRAVQRLSMELEELRTSVAQRDQQERDDRVASESLHATVAERGREIIARDEQITHHQRELDEHKQRLEEHARALVERDERLAELRRQLTERDQRVAEQRAELDDRERAVASFTSELEHAHAAIQAHNRELTSLRDTLLASNRDLELLRVHKHRLEAELSEMLTRLEEGESQKGEVREQIAGLEAELKEEKEATENLSELANERREQITKLTEQVEEANERYEEAKWRLGKTARFERLVRRRKGLINALLEALRAKTKANTALKAGLDGLRTHKATAEANQQKLLARVDSLKAELEEAEETIARYQGSTLGKEQIATSETRAGQLELRLITQAELIESLEADLKAAKAMSKSGEERHEIARLREELAAKDKDLKTKLGVITQLQSDVDEQQRKLAKLRGSETETLRLKAISDKDRTSIDALEREIAQLREALTRQSASGNAAASNHGSAELEAKLKERENSVTRLMGTVKEHEATIKKLSEAVESWKRKYQFLSADAPDAYKAAGEK